MTEVADKTTKLKFMERWGRVIGTMPMRQQKPSCPRCKGGGSIQLERHIKWRCPRCKGTGNAY